MHGSDFFAASEGGWTAVSLPYRGGKLAMTALLPPAGSGGCPALSAATLHEITAALAPFPPGRAEPGPARAMASVALPKVSLRTSASMQPLLTRLGMGIAFGGGADFTGLSSEAGSIGVVIHAATLAVTEKGTVASAATAVGIEPSAGVLPMRQVVFDRPYLMLVTDTATGEPLFLARVADPG
jgi:serpin B